jgi:hypothetical protein
VEKAERDLILRQGVTLPDTPRDRRERASLDEDLIELRGRPLSLRAVNFRPTAEAYLAASRGPLVYMLRLRTIELEVAAHEDRLGEQWLALAVEHDHDADAFAEAWTLAAEAVSFDELNDLVERHNRWYPAESLLPMDPRTGDFALVNGRDFRLERFDADWILERFPPVLEAALASGRHRHGVTAATRQSRRSLDADPVLRGSPP